MIREVLQNSLDARYGDLGGPVEVEIAESYVDGRTIGAEELEKHLDSCLERARQEERKNVQAFYVRALKALESEKIRCLQIVDTGTLGPHRSQLGCSSISGRLGPETRQRTWWF